MQHKIKIAGLLTALTIAIAGCASKGENVSENKPNPLPKINQTSGLNQIYAIDVSSSSAHDRVKLELEVLNDTVFVADPKGEIIAYRGKQRLWENKVSAAGISAGVEAGNGVVVAGNRKGQLFALDAANGQKKWQAQLTGAILAPSLILGDRVITVSNDGTVYAHDIASGQQAWTYSLPNTQFSVRGNAAPVKADDRTVIIGSSNAYVFALDVLTGVPVMQRRVAVSEGRSDLDRLNDIDGEPVIAGKYLVTTSYQGQVMLTDLAEQRVIWFEKSSSVQRPEVTPSAIFVTETDGTIKAFDFQTGQQIWQNKQLLNRGLTNPVMLGNELVVGDYEGVLHLIQPQTGKITGRAKTSGAIGTLRVVNGKLLVGTQKGKMSIWQR